MVNRKYALVFGAAACVLFWLAAAPAGAAKNKPKRFTGRIQSIDAEAGTLVLKGRKGAPREFKLTQETAFTKGGDRKKIGPPDVKPGDKARVEYVGAAALTVHIRVMPAKKPRKKGGKKKPQAAPQDDEQ
ncbi:MAG: hypothetical protein ABIJ96_14790 [Elusimicrobiota bacterium]